MINCQGFITLVSENMYIHIADAVAAYEVDNTYFPS